MIPRRCAPAVPPAALLALLLALLLAGGPLAGPSAAARWTRSATAPATVQEPARLTGTVEDHFGSGWVVELTPVGAGAPTHSVSTGEGTAFELTGVPPGEYLIRASHPDSGTVGPATPITLRPGDNGSTTLVFTGPPPGELPASLGPLTGRVTGMAPDAVGVVVELLHDYGGEPVPVAQAVVAEDGTFSADPQVAEGYALPILLRAVQTLPDGSTETVYLGGSATPEGATPIVPAEGVQESYELAFPPPAGVPASPASSPGGGAQEPAASGPPPPAVEAAVQEQRAGAAQGRGPAPGAWVLLGAAALGTAGAVVALRRRRAG